MFRRYRDQVKPRRQAILTHLSWLPIAPVGNLSQTGLRSLPSTTFKLLDIFTDYAVTPHSIDRVINSTVKQTQNNIIFLNVFYTHHSFFFQ